MKRTKEENKELCERMPYLIPRNVWTGEIVEDYDYSYIEGDYDLPDGWNKLFLQMCEDIRQPLIDANYLDEFRFSQIKEKYNTMRCYNFGAPESVYDILNKYEHMSQFICQKCGKPATKETTGWIASYCDDCLQDDDETEKITFEPTFTIISHSKDGESKTVFDCTDEWERLYE